MSKLQTRRTRRTRKSVVFAEHASKLLITVGGIGTILAVSLIFFFLVWVALPLFGGASVEAGGEVAVASKDAEPARVLTDEYQVLSAIVYADGLVQVVRQDTGEDVALEQLTAETPTSIAFAPGSDLVAFGFGDGSIQVGTLGFAIEFPSEVEVSDEPRLVEGGLLTVTSEGNPRIVRFHSSLEEPMATAGSRRIEALDISETGSGRALAAMDDAGAVTLYGVRERENLLTGVVTRSLTEHPVPYRSPDGRGNPDHLLLTGLGDNLFLVWDDGRLVRMDVRDRSHAVEAEILDVTDGDERVSAITFLLGKSTLLVGTSGGQMHTWFLTKPEDAGTVDGTLLSRAREFPRAESAVALFAPSPRSRLVAVGYASGDVRMYHATSLKELLSASAGGAGELAALTLLPKEDGLVAMVGDRLARWVLDPKHPEASFASLFRPVWYEGYEKPEHVWQSSSGTDDFEEKLGMFPLVYGTLKATFYSMLFGAPIALLAAIYTSEFMSRKVRAPVKSTIEIMASLPSVVLGFLAALVIAPFVQSVLPATLAVLGLWPFTLLLGAHAWQLLPRKRQLQWGGFPRLLCMGATLPIALGAAVLAGPLIESLFFAGDVELWLDGQIGSGVGGWMFLLLPLSSILTAYLFATRVSPVLRRLAEHWSPGQYARADFAKFLLGSAATLALSLGLSWLLNSLGWDPRGSFVGTFVQRNALVVGFVMGFAVIPIIYTLAEDALASVPEHLRLASLGAGATPWQTAVRVIVPTAMSGLFSALMVGLGRAVGETMIVLMATGNTPVMNMNIFSGFRTLSANIAVELPEAVVNSTHYRTLFLAGLLLFGMTFLVNTCAELVRQRFRKRAYQL